MKWEGPTNIDNPSWNSGSRIKVTLKSSSAPCWKILSKSNFHIFPIFLDYLYNDMHFWRELQGTIVQWTFSYSKWNCEHCKYIKPCYPLLLCLLPVTSLWLFWMSDFFFFPLLPAHYFCHCLFKLKVLFSAKNPDQVCLYKSIKKKKKNKKNHLQTDKEWLLLSDLVTEKISLTKSCSFSLKGQQHKSSCCSWRCIHWNTYQTQCSQSFFSVLNVNTVPQPSCSLSS